MPQRVDVHVDQPLSNFAVEYKNPAGLYIANRVAPPVLVPKQSDKYFVYDKKDRFTRPKTARGPKGKANTVDWNVSSDTYKCNDRALRDFVSDATVANSDAPIQPRQKTAAIVTDLLLLDREIDVLGYITTYANYGSSMRTQLTGTDQFTDYTNSDPIGVIDTGKAACFMDPNYMFIGKSAYDKLKRHPQLLDHVKGGATSGDPATITAAQMAEVFEIQNVVVSSAKYNTANKGQTSIFDYIMGDSIVLAYIDAAAQMEGISAFKTFVWQQMATGIGYKVRSYRDEEVGGGGEWIEVETSDDFKVVCSDVAYLIYDTNE
jgi:hypothetical protein